MSMISIELNFIIIYFLIEQIFYGYSKSFNKLFTQPVQPRNSGNFKNIKIIPFINAIQQ